MVKVARKIRLKDEGKDLAYWRSRPLLERLRAVDSLRRMYINTHVAPGQQRLPRVCRVVKFADASNLERKADRVKARPKLKRIQNGKRKK
jgi:hypothetical protein